MADDKTEDSDARLSRVVNYYERAAEVTMESRKLAERDRDYYDGRQWTADEITKLQKRGQPVIVRNRVKPKIDSLLGLEKQGRTDPRANPRTPMDEDAANAATDSIRFVCDIENFSQKRSEVFENILCEGTGGAIVEVDGKQNINIRQIPWDRIFFDPHSRFKDFRDAKYKGIVVWLDEDEAKAIYGEKADPILDSSWSAYDNTRTYDDKPSHQRWVDGTRKRIKVVELYYRESGNWTYCVYTKAGFLVDPQPSAYLDEEGEPECPIEFMSCHMDRENNRYGLVRQLIGPQDEVNKRASKALHRMTTQQVMSERGAVDDIQRAKRELAKPDGWIEYNPGMKVEIQKNSDLTAFEMQMLSEAKQEIDSVGANAALQGKGEAESGKALQIRRQSGVVEVGSSFDSLHQWQQAVYKQIWHRIKQFWTAEKWIRVTDDPGNLRFVGLNVVDPATGKVRNPIAEMDVDIELDDVPDVATTQQEEFSMLAEAYKSNPQTPVNPMGIPFDIVIEHSSLRSKKEILDRLRGGSAIPGGPVPGQEQAGPPQGPEMGPGPNQLGPQAPMPDPMQALGQIMDQAAGQLQQMAQQIIQGVQQAAQEAAGAIQGVGQQTAQAVQQAGSDAVSSIQATAQGIQQAGQDAASGVQQAGLEAVAAVQQAAGQATAQVSSNAAAAGITAMIGTLNQPKPAMQVVRDMNGRISGVVPVG